MANTSYLSELRAALETLEKFQLPEKFGLSQSLSESPTSAVATGTTVIDASLLERYQQARDRYLKYRFGDSFFDRLIHGAGHHESTEEDDDHNDEVKEQLKQAAKERLDQLRRKAQQRFFEVHQQHLQVKRDCVDFCKRRERLREMIQELEHTNNDAEDDLSDDEEEVDEEALALEEERIETLTKQKEELQAQLQSVQEETARLTSEANQSQMQLREMLRQRGANVDDADFAPDEHVAAIEAETEELQQKLQEAKERSIFYEDMCAAYEHFGGIKVVSVVEDSANDLLLTLELLQDSRYIIELTLRPQPEDKRMVQVIHAKFLPSTNPITIRLPNLEELVKYTGTNTMKMMPGNECARFVIREAMMQIRAAEARETELTILFSEFPQVTDTSSTVASGQSSSPSLASHMESLQVATSSTAFGTVVATLHLSSECPLVRGSVYLEQLAGVAAENSDDSGDRDTTVLENIKQKINEKKFMSPVALMQAVRDELVTSNNSSVVTSE
jgi:hypothetical protein